jgi:hypothetical protein
MRNFQFPINIDFVFCSKSVKYFDKMCTRKKGLYVFVHSPFRLDTVQGPYSQNFFMQIHKIFVTLTCILELISHQK